MKKRLISFVLCLTVLMMSFVVSVGAVSPVAPSGVTSTKTVSAAALPYTVSYGTTDGKTVSALTAYDAQTLAALQAGCDGVTTDSVTGIPCQVYEIDASGTTAETVVVALHAATVQNERMALKVFNPATAAWDTLDTAVTSGYLSADVARATYADASGKIKAMVTPDYVTNGSNRFIWSTDQQHYAEFEDLNATYYAIHEYMVKEYQNGTAAYVINTGDIVDDTPHMATAKAQWTVADKAFAILDKGNVPYGIASGNHDVGDYPMNNYTHYLNHFNASRYENNPWYGGTRDDNKSHYDLVTVGNVDFIILYFGYGQGDQMELLDWANSVLKQYPHRAAILATHQYLRPSTLQRTGRADLIHERVVVENENVVMVLSGHYSGAGYRTITLDDGRKVHEVVADYQFVQKESLEYYQNLGVKDPTHSIGSVPDCNGEGYLREVIIEGNTVSMHAFSPVTGGENPFGARDDVTLTVEYPAANRFITSYHFTAAALGDDGEIDLTKWAFGDGSAEYAHIPESGYTQTTVTNYADAANLQALVERAEKLDAAVYTADSYKVMTDAVATAKAALTQTDISVTRQAYTTLANAIGGLVKQKETIDRYSLIMVHQMNLTMDLWKNGNGVSSLDNAKSHIAFQQNENGGFTIQKGKFAANDWPDIHYLTPIVLTPVDGKVYLYLDLEANSTWSIFPTFIQGNDTYTGRLNYIIEGSYDETFDAGAGRYYGVYDISDALTALGLDLSKEFIMTFVMNVVPGPVTVNEIAVLTGTPLDIQGTLDRASKIDKTLYTEESYAAFAAAYEKAKAALNTPDAYQATLDLQAKMIGLKKIEEKGTPMGLIIGIIVGAVLALAVIVVIIVVILAAKKKKGGNAPDEAPANE